MAATTRTADTNSDTGTAAAWTEHVIDQRRADRSTPGQQPGHTVRHAPRRRIDARAPRPTAGTRTPRQRRVPRRAWPRCAERPRPMPATCGGRHRRRGPGIGVAHRSAGARPSSSGALIAVSVALVASRVGDALVRDRSERGRAPRSVGIGVGGPLRASASAATVDDDASDAADGCSSWARAVPRRLGLAGLPRSETCCSASARSHCSAHVGRQPGRRSAATRGRQLRAIVALPRASATQGIGRSCVGSRHSSSRLMWWLDRRRLPRAWARALAGRRAWSHRSSAPYCSSIDFGDIERSHLRQPRRSGRVPRRLARGRRATTLVGRGIGSPSASSSLRRRARWSRTRRRRRRRGHRRRSRCSSATLRWWASRHDPPRRRRSTRRRRCRRRGPMTTQWRKWRSPVKTMAMPCSSAAAITSSSRTTAAGLHDRGDAGGRGHVEPVAEREEGVAGARHHRRRGRRPARRRCRPSRGGSAGRRRCRPPGRPWRTRWRCCVTAAHTCQAKLEVGPLLRRSAAPRDHLPLGRST